MRTAFDKMSVLNPTSQLDVVMLDPIARQRFRMHYAKACEKDQP
jgi:hypothetical protein